MWRVISYMSKLQSLLLDFENAQFVKRSIRLSETGTPLLIKLRSTFQHPIERQSNTRFFFHSLRILMILAILIAIQMQIQIHNGINMMLWSCMIYQFPFVVIHNKYEKRCWYIISYYHSITDIAKIKSTSSWFFSPSFEVWWWSSKKRVKIDYTCAFLNFLQYNHTLFYFFAELAVKQHGCTGK